MNKWALISDFDRTITTTNVAEDILTHFKAATKIEIENSNNPAVNIDEWIDKTFAKLRATPDKIKEYVLKNILIRDGFQDLNKFCKAQKIPLEVVSGGLDIYSDTLFEKWKLDCKSFFGKANFTTDGGYAIDYPYLKQHSLDAFKESRVKRHQDKGFKVIFCGDGISDFKAAKAADKVYAADKLSTLCAEADIKNSPLENFFDIKKFIIKDSSAAL